MVCGIALECDTLLGRFCQTSRSVAGTFAGERDDIFVSEYFVALDALFRWLDERVCACLADDMPTWFHDYIEDR